MPFNMNPKTEQCKSTLSKKFKTQAWKAAKKAKALLNREHRANLESEKSTKGRSADKALIQSHIDKISEGILV